MKISILLDNFGSLIEYGKNIRIAIRFISKIDFLIH